MHVFISPNGNTEVWEVKPEGYLSEAEWRAMQPVAQAPTLIDVQTAKRAEINAGFDAALAASLTMPSINTPPSTVELTVAIGLFNAEDPVGLVDLCAIHSARRASLVAAVDAATTLAEVQAITVTYAV